MWPNVMITLYEIDLGEEEEEEEEEEDSASQKILILSFPAQPKLTY